jgi:repressor LexA
MNQRKTDILAYISKHNDEKSYSPSFREIAIAVGLKSSSTVAGHIERFVRDGILLHRPGSPRTLKVVGKIDQISEVKVLKSHENIPSEIEWEGIRFVIDPTMR